MFPDFIFKIVSGKLSNIFSITLTNKIHEVSDTKQIIKPCTSVLLCTDAYMDARLKM